MGFALTKRVVPCTGIHRSRTGGDFAKIAGLDTSSPAETRRNLEQTPTAV